MPRFCHNCGDLVEEGEVFCDKCGTKIISEEEGQKQYETRNNSYGQNHYNNSINQQGMNYQSMDQYNHGKKNVRKKQSGWTVFIKIVGVFLAIGIVLIAALLVLGRLLDLSGGANPGNNPNPPSVTSDPNNTTPSATEKPGAAKAVAAWSADLNAYTTYSEKDKKINVEYTVTLTNNGTGAADLVKLYLDPRADDEDAQYIGIIERTIINTDQEIKRIKAGETKEMKTSFYYSNIDVSAVTQEILQEISNSFVRIPVLVEWQENGKMYTQILELQ
jgi:hypothetical protein